MAVGQVKWGLQEYSRHTVLACILRLFECFPQVYPGFSAMVCKPYFSVDSVQRSRTE